MIQTIRQLYKQAQFHTAQIHRERIDYHSSSPLESNTLEYGFSVLHQMDNIDFPNRDPYNY